MNILMMIPKNIEIVGNVNLLPKSVVQEILSHQRQIELLQFLRNLPDVEPGLRYHTRVTFSVVPDFRGLQNRITP